MGLGINLSVDFPLLFDIKCYMNLETTVGTSLLNRDLVGVNTTGTY